MNRNFSWQPILQSLGAGEPVILLVVVASVGSAPGKPGFVMAVSKDKTLQGSIGGGAVEYELVDYAYDLLHSATGRADKVRPEFLHRTHRDSGSKDDSGMVCGGSQQVLLYPLQEEQIRCIQEVIECLEKGQCKHLCLSSVGMTLEPWEPVRKEAAGGFRFTSSSDWSFVLEIGAPDTAYLIGGGHVSLALANLLASLGFRIVVFDERDHIGTLQANVWADEKIICPFSEVGQHIPQGEQSWVVIMTPSHLYDEQVLRQLIAYELHYLGMLASKTKVAQIFNRLRSDGIKEAVLSRVHAPVGLPMNSQTPEEIAVSIAAEFIQIRNSSLCTVKYQAPEENKGIRIRHHD
ncbi:MAG: XdhC family protein [Candidatus Electrothrix communis]|nr:MAG: XdhC family protein [Candidatus Electrothrix communis]